MPAPDASTPARDAVDAFIQHLAERGLSATTRRIRKTYLGEYLRHAQQATGDGVDADDAEGQDGTSARPLTAGDLMDADRAAAWLADAAAGKTRTRNTNRGPDAAAYPNSMRVRIDSVNAFAEFIGHPARLDRQPPARGFQLAPERQSKRSACAKRAGMSSMKRWASIEPPKAAYAFLAAS